jgi:hypothetical protein
MPHVKLNRFLSGAVLALSVAAIAFGWRSLSLQTHGLSVGQPIEQALLEKLPADAEGAMNVTPLTISRLITWEQLGNERGISTNLLEETYTCTYRGGRRKYSDFKAVELTPRTVLSVVLKSGACDRPSKE